MVSFSVITCTVMRAMQESSACMKFALAESSLHCTSDSECGAAGFHTCYFAQLELECIVRMTVLVKWNLSSSMDSSTYAKKRALCNCNQFYSIWWHQWPNVVSICTRVHYESGHIHLYFLAIWTLHWMQLHSASFFAWCARVHAPRLPEMK